ncbi:unnamed protein product, partial [Vitis vinifera]
MENVLFLLLLLLLFFLVDKKGYILQNLMGELQRVSKQLTYLEQECLELRKERDEKEEKLKNVYSQMEAKGAEVHYLKSRNL